MTDKRRGLGRGLGALIPSAAVEEAVEEQVVTPQAPLSRPVDLFFPEAKNRRTGSRAVSRETARNGSDPRDNGRRPEERTRGSETGTVSVGSDPMEAPASVPGSTGAGTADAVNPEIATPTAGVRPVVGAEAGADQRTGGQNLLPVPGATFAQIPVGDIQPNRKQPRNVFDEGEMAELIHSVKTVGVLQPIVVRRSTEHDRPYELVMGERRWRAAQLARMETVPAIIRDTGDDDLLRDALLENLHRSQLNPLEEAAAYQQLLEDFGTTHEQLADRIGRSRPQVSNTLRLLRLPALVQARVAAGVLSAGHARALLGLPDAQAMERVAQRIVQEGLSVRSTEEAVAMYQEPQAGRSGVPKQSARHERLDFLATSLSDRLDTNVKITLGARKGKVSIEFASVEDLNRIMDVIAPGGAG